MKGRGEGGVLVLETWSDIGVFELGIIISLGDLWAVCECRKVKYPFCSVVDVLVVED